MCVQKEQRAAVSASLVNKHHEKTETNNEVVPLTSHSCVPQSLIVF